eukprot:TRINITY_DN75695_c0_g1_i1.p1 TRINITY_DN75695_c0_g1~~TRINITY_DN75695_c0_g1_i1.p1  ORF type:complete len:373 (-),score=71.15 TRINITY_DN75695_c0_g1_i1:166-1242(-)
MMTASVPEHAEPDVLAKVDACAFMVLDRWGSSLEMFTEGSDCLFEMIEVASETRDEDLMSCTRLRLVARMAKVLRLLNNFPGPSLAAAAQNWADTVPQNAEGAAAAVDALLAVRDVGLSEGATSAAAAASQNSEHLITLVIRAAQRLNEALPKPTARDVLSQLEAGLAQRVQCSQADAPNSTKDTQECMESITVCSSDSQASQATVPGRPSASSAPTEVQHKKRRSLSAAGDAGADESQSSQASLQEAADASGSSRQAPALGNDIFLAPLLGDEPAAKRVRSAAPVTEDGDSEVKQGDVPSRPRSYESWTEQEERRLIDGYKKYGKSWATIRTTCSLRHRTQIQIKDKWRNLHKAGAV